MDSGEESKRNKGQRRSGTSREVARREPGYPPLVLAAPDSSIGQSKELFGMTLEGEQQMASKLSPPGLDARTMKALAEATLDVIQLPGTSITVEAESTGDLVGAIREMAEDRQYDWSDDRPPKDALWKASSRTSLLTIKDEVALRERFNEFSGLPEEVYETQVHRFQGILSKLHWSLEMVDAWSRSNWFLRIGSDTLRLYIELHLHLVTLSTTEGWTYAKEALNHYTAKLAQFRKTNTTRLTCLLKIYIFLRDARKNDFYSAKLQEKRNLAIMTKLNNLESHGIGGGGNGGGGTSSGCKKCGLSHPGGVRKCLFKGLADGEAKKRVAQLLRTLGGANVE
jgi:hypothetical protein